MSRRSFVLALLVACSGSDAVPEPRCGDGLASAGEGCDGADLRGMSCATFGFNSGALMCHPSCVVDLRACATVELCGNGRDDDGDSDKDCDDADCAASAACAVCGDGLVTGPEECDDQNDRSGDCCDRCRAEAGCEHEPNDGLLSAMSLAGDTVGASIQPSGDVDHFALDVPEGMTAIVSAETIVFAAGDSCTGGVDPYLELRAPDGSLVAADDDGGVGSCSFIRTAGLGPGQVTLAVRASPFAPDLVFGYRLHVTVTLAGCGDGLISEGQECDDGNRVDGDGCSSRCRLEVRASHEPDGEPGLAFGPLAPPFVVAGTIDAPGADNTDSDWVAIDLAAPANLVIETSDDASPTCDAIIAEPSLHGPDGSLLRTGARTASADRCWRLASADGLPDPLGKPFPQLPAGRYLVEVKGRPSPARYRLRVSVQSWCGNGVVEPPEQCDGAAGCSGCAWP